MGLIVNDHRSRLEEKYLDLLAKVEADELYDEKETLSISMPSREMWAFRDACLFNDRRFKDVAREILNEWTVKHGPEVTIDENEKKIKQLQGWNKAQRARMKAAGSMKLQVLEKMINEAVRNIEIIAPSNNRRMAASSSGNQGFVENNQPVGVRDVAKVMNSINTRFLETDVKLVFEILETRVAKIKNKVVRTTFLASIREFKATQYPELYPTIAKEVEEKRKKEAKEEEEAEIARVKAELNKKL